MNYYRQTSDASSVYRPTANAAEFKLNQTGDVANVMGILKNSSVIVSAPYQAATNYVLKSTPSEYQG